MAGLDSRYISSLDLEPYFVSNQNGEANAGGVVTFYIDTNRTTLKLVYQLSKDPMTGVYSYVPLPNPITLSGVGTFQNAAGDNIAVYYFPYDQFGNQELYYITVDDAFGNRQFTREAWPFPNIGGASASANAIGLTNQLSNPTFAIVNFITGSTLTVPVAGAGTTTITIAPDWDLVIVATGASVGGVMVTQTPIAGSQRLPNNPPFTLDFVLGTNLTSVQLIQTLNNNPDWAAPQVTGTGGYLSGSILLGIGTHISLQYKPSAGNGAQTILEDTNISGAYKQSAGTIELLQGTNTGTGVTGFDQIIINILSASASISNVQVIPLPTNISGVQYDQTPVNRQIDYLFNYYNDLLQYKPISSYLIGWDFALNPAQFLGDSIAAQGVGANKSYYAWDQTIAFQSINSALTISRGTGNTAGSFRVTAAATSKFAIVQYEETITAIEILFHKLSVNIAATTDMTSIPCTISLWYTQDVTLPHTWTANNSLIATLDNNGKPATFNGTWLEIARLPVAGGSASTQDATFNLIPGDFPNYGFSGWDSTSINSAHAATFFAIVVGFGALTIGKSVEIESISLVPGDIPTIPAPQTLQAVLAECQRYYEKSFDTNDIPATNKGTDTGETIFLQAVGASTGSSSGSITYKVSKWKDPDLITTYNPNVANAQVRNQTINADCSAVALTRNSFNSFMLNFTTPGASAAANILAVHWSSNATLGY